MTDPPYFDFVHYSELSDFFFAWLSPVLRGDTPCFDRADSSHEGEVQDRDPETFATKIARVFVECYRVLKTDGILAFTFHHSKPEGWLAIYRALANSGFIVTTAHPMKAEMSVGNPKAAAKEPINLDAILVCRKKDAVPSVSCDVSKAARDESAQLMARFTKIGRHLSRGDRFVITASQVLHHASVGGVGEESVLTLLKEAHKRCHENESSEQRVAVLTPPSAATGGRPSSKTPAVQQELFDSSATQR